MTTPPARIRRPPTDRARHRQAARATWLSAALNLALTVVQLIVGWVAHSQALIAHGLHSFSDLLSDFLVLYANHQGSQPADLEHPYGHARIETAATLILGISLSAVGFGILWQATLDLQHVAELPAVEWLALWVALFTALAKEALFRYLIRVARRLRSALVAANAWHTRTDAASALVVVAGVGGALLGWPFLDLLAAAIMAFMILHMGLKLAWSSLRELIDTGLAPEQVEQIRRILLETPGVRGLHALRTRRMAHQALVDAHLLVDPRISVSEGHRISEQARCRVLEGDVGVTDVLVHIDAEDDELRLGACEDFPERAALMAQIRDWLGAEAEPIERTVLHFLGRRVEAEVFLGEAVWRDAERLARIEARLRQRRAAFPIFRRISLNGRLISE